MQSAEIVRSWGVTGLGAEYQAAFHEGRRCLFPTYSSHARHESLRWPRRGCLRWACTYLVPAGWLQFKLLQVTHQHDYSALACTKRCSSVGFYDSGHRNRISPAISGFMLNTVLPLSFLLLRTYTVSRWMSRPFVWLRSATPDATFYVNLYAELMVTRSKCCVCARSSANALLLTPDLGRGILISSLHVV